MNKSNTSSTSGWVPVSKRLPEYMTGVIVYAPNMESVYCCYYYFHSGSNAKNEDPIWAFFDNDGRIVDVDEEITHWMPTPNKPNATECVRENKRLSE